MAKAAPKVTEAIPVALSPVQREFYLCKSRVKGFIAGRGSGKTVLGSLDILNRAKKGRHYFYGAPSVADLKDYAVPVFESWCSKLSRYCKVSKSDTRGEFETSDGGLAKITFRTAEDPDKFRGPSISGAVVDEAAKVSKKAIDILAGCLREGGEAGWIVYLTTPKGKSHWTYDELVRNPLPDTRLFRCGTHENPFVNPEWVADLMRRYGLDESNFTGTSWARQELLAEFLDDEDALLRWEDIIAASIDPGLCLWSGIPSYSAELYHGVDVGRTKDLTVFWTWEKMADGTMFCRELIVLQNMPFRDQVNTILRHVRNNSVRLVIDKGGIGYQMAEELEKRLPGVARGVQLNSATKGRIANRLAVAFEAHAVRIPADEVLQEDLQLVRKTIDQNGISIIESERKTNIGHADRFWAAALGFEAAELSMGRLEVGPPKLFRPDRAKISRAGGEAIKRIANRRIKRAR